MNDLAVIDSAFEITDTGLQITRALTFDEWMIVGARLWAGYQAYKWAISDWLIYGEHKYGEKYAQASALLDYKPQTLMNYASTARSIPAPERRATVSFSNHQEVASLDPLSRVQALDKLENKVWNRDDLRQWKRALKGDTTPTEQTISLQYKAHTIKDGILTVSFVAPIEAWHIVGYKAIVSTSKPERMAVAS